MKKIVLLDTATGSTNKGDSIIMKCVEEELAPLLENYFPIYVPTHLSSFRTIECFGRLPDSAKEINDAKYKFVCGTNLLSGNMLNRTNQWNINYFNCKPVCGSVLMGVGSVGAIKPNKYTKKLYNKILSHEFFHSVREERAYRWMCEMGFKCMNTGCVTMWKLTPELCSKIPEKKSDEVIFTLTDYKKEPKTDSDFLSVLRKYYSKLYFWMQGIYDFEYLKSLGDVSDITIIPPSLDLYEKVLCTDVDYVGTRLHAGIYAMRKGKRSLILRVDDRMNSMANTMPNNSVLRTDLENIEKKIKGEIITEINLNWRLISEWKGQFC